MDLLQRKLQNFIENQGKNIIYEEIKFESLINDIFYSSSVKYNISLLLCRLEILSKIANSNKMNIDEIDKYANELYKNFAIDFYKAKYYIWNRILNTKISIKISMQETYISTANKLENTNSLKNIVIDYIIAR